MTMTKDKADIILSFLNNSVSQCVCRALLKSGLSIKKASKQRKAAKEPRPHIRKSELGLGSPLTHCGTFHGSFNLALVSFSVLS